MALHEFGFWVYTSPGSGQESHYSLKDWKILLDDMASAGMNSLAIVIKWGPAGYKSSFAWLDQDKSVSIIASGNELLYQVMDLAHARNIKVWLVAVCSYYQIKEFGIVAPNGKTEGVFHYDPDYPGVLERMCLMFGEITGLFGKVADGIVVEMESVEFDWPYRIPLYNQWAEENKRPVYEEIKLQYMDARAYQKHHWRDFLTSRRCRALKEIERTVKDAGFKGKLSMICETSNEYGSYVHAVNLDQYKNAMPGWAAVTYDYTRNLNRLSGVDFCMEQPIKAGLETYFLGRGVMTYQSEALSIPLVKNWEIDLEDAIKFQPDGFWFFSSDSDETVNPHSHAAELKKMGFENGIQARKKLLELCGKFKPL